MKSLFPSLIFALAESLFASGVVEQLDAGLVNPGYHEQPNWFIDSFLDIREDVQNAADKDKRLILYFYQDGCPYCAKLLRDNFGNQEIADKTREHFDVIAINLWGDREVTDFDGHTAIEKDFAKNLKVQYTPTLLFFDEAGTVLTRINGYFEPHLFSTVLDFVAEHKETEMSVRSYIAQRNPQPASGKLHAEDWFLQSPLDLSSVGNKPLLLMFEQKQCAVCDELHRDILQRDPIRKSFEQFQVALIDLWSKETLTDFDGSKIDALHLAEKLGVQYAPSLVFFIGAKEVFRTGAYLRAFHIHGALDYVLSSAYLEQPEFQRFLRDRRAELEAQGAESDIWE